jgi:hypothetical protein
MGVLTRLQVGISLLKRLKPYCQQILQESARRTWEFGLTRLEYPTLMLLVLEKC